MSYLPPPFIPSFASIYLRCSSILEKTLCLVVNATGMGRDVRDSAALQRYTPSYTV